MKKEITIEYMSGDSATYVAYPPDFAKWERKTGKSIQLFETAGIDDIMFIAYSAMKREAGGKPVKPFEAWSETIADIDLGGDNPKALSEEA